MTAQDGYVLEAERVGKKYRTVTALEDVTVRFSANKIYGLFGRNGAGKTTLLDVIAARIFPDGGKVTYRGEDVSKESAVFSRSCCYMPEKQYFPPKLKAKDILEMASFSFPAYNVAYAEELCCRFRLDTERRYGDLSRGYQSILRIVIGLASRAPITLFDEPALGLDAAARDGFYRELIEEFSENPRLFIISTHLIEESAELFNEAIILHEGKVIKRASVEELLSGTFSVSGKAENVEAFLTGRNTLHRESVGGISIAVVEGDRVSGKEYPDLNFSAMTIQSLFIHLTGGREERERNGE